jgi:hypothetical protein
MSWERLSDGTSRTEHTCKKVGEKGCRGCRWFETRLYRDDEGDYKIEIIGKSIVPGEVDRIRVEHTSSAHAVVDFLALGEPGHRYIPKISRKVLHEAADEDEAIGEAIDDFDSMVTPS